MTAASEGKLGALHNKLADVMGNALEQIETNQQAYELQVKTAIEEENPEALPISAPDLNPALLSVIERFLGNNKISCVPEEGNAMGDLERKLEAKKARRKMKVVGGTAHMDED